MSLTKHCKKILEQNLLKPEETLLVATPHMYPADLVRAFMDAAAEIGATGGHLEIIPRIKGNDLVSGLTAWHWSTYASADLLVTIVGHGLNAEMRREVPRPTSDYIEKVGNHPYRTDHEFINREGGKTRWLDVMMPVYQQRLYFPTQERADRTLAGAKILDKAKEFRITSKSGSDYVQKKVGRPGHAQYGIADYPGRWDNFGYGCVATMPEEYTAEGTIVMGPGSIIPPMGPQAIVDETIKLTFKGGYVTDVEGGPLAKRFSAFLASYGEKETYGVSHVGWGTHEKASLGEATPDEVDNYHHNAAGSILFSLGVNYGHGLGGPGTKYSGGGPTLRKSKSHTHFTIFDGDFYCDSEKIIENGKLLGL